MMCGTLGVTKSGFYSWCGSQKKMDYKKENMVLQIVRDIASESRYTYGSRRIREKLCSFGFSFCRNTVRRLMKKADIMVRYRKKYKTTTNSNHDYPVYENLLERNFYSTAPNQVYVSDITYIRTMEGWLYLAVVIDLYN